MKKTAGRLALAAAAGMMSTSAFAADIGGSCCSDLEERIAELEATAARKGNRIMSLTISGQVGVNFVYHNADNFDAYREGQISIDQDEGEYTNALTFSGDAKLSSDITIGYKMDFDVNTDSGMAATTDDQFVFVRSARLGAVQMGRIDAASDGIHATSIGTVIGQMSATETGGFATGRSGVTLTNGTGTGGTGYLLPTNFDGRDAEPGIKYISPTFGGFTFLAAYQHDKLFTDETEDRWSVALRYANEFNGVRFAWAIGYEQGEESDLDLGGNFNQPTDDENEFAEFVTAVAFMHVPTGLFANFAYGFATSEVTQDDGTVDSDTRDSGFTVVLGIERKWNALGATSLYAKYQHRDFEDELDSNNDLDSDNFGFGIVQDIDAAAAQVYLKWDRYECADPRTGASAAGNPNCSDDADVISSGMIVKF
ncbi:MAG: hypothetical protein AAFZ05_14435 [Pseudomonadota bacterium]